MAARAKDAPRTLHEGHAVYTDYLCMMVPLVAWPVFLYGLRPLVLCLVAGFTAQICDILASRLRSRPYDRSENSSVAHAILLAMLLPATVPYYVVIIAVSFAVLIAKEAFGGYGAYPFHPTAVGYAVAAVSWPQFLFRYPTPFQGNLPLWGDMTGVQFSDGISHVMKNGGMPNVESIDLWLGNYPSAIGTAPALILLACFLFLLARRRAKVAAPLSFLLGAAAFAWCFPRIGEVQGMIWQGVAQRAQSVQFELLSGAMLFCAVFLISEPVVCPKRLSTSVVYGLLLGIFSMLYSYYGTFETGVCFALIVMNAATGYIDRVAAKLAAHKKGGKRHVG